MTPRLLHDFFDSTRRTTALVIPPGRDRPARIDLTYEALSQRADALGAWLPLADEPNAVVAILLPRTSPDAYAAILAVLRRGGAYAAIDPAVPDARVLAILTDATPIAIVTDGAGEQRLTAAGFASPRVVTVDADWRAGAQATGSLVPAPVDENSLAYLIYTSGSTGRPKGVMVEHGAIVNLVSSDIDALGMQPTDRVAQGSSLAYDSSIEEMWLAWAVGAAVVVLDDETVRSGPDLSAWLEAERVSVFCPPPTLLRTIGGADVARRLTRLRLLYVGGEALTTDVVDAWAPGRRLVNGYGPTECTVVALRADVRVGGPITIGRPITNVCACVLGPGGDEVQPGEVGELCLGGVGLSRGYWRDPELTSSKFTTHPTYGRIYHTGDLVQQMPTGEFMYAGRADTQVKVRGHRLELEEVEAHLARVPGVRAAACRLASAGDQSVLAAFVVAADAAHPPDTELLRRALARDLPAHAIPQAVVWVSSLPTTIGGKLDRARLPGTVTMAPRSSGEPPRDDLERHLAACLAATLASADAVDRDAHFFEDLGGDSVRAAQWISALRGSDQTASLTVRDVYEAPSVAALAVRARMRDDASERASSGPLPLAADRPVSTIAPLLVTIAQGAWLVLEGALAAWLGYLLLFRAAPAFVSAVDPVTAIVMAPLLAMVAVVAYTGASLACAIAVKWTVIGRYEPRRTSVWSAYYLRHWIVQQASRTVPWSLLAGTEYQAIAWRALGARIGQRVHLHRGVHLASGWDLLEIGDDSTLGRDVALQVIDLDAGDIVAAPISLGCRVTIEVRAAIAGDVVIGDDGWIGPQAAVLSGARVPAQALWEGIPAVPVGVVCPHVVVPAGRLALSPWAFAAVRVMSELLLAVLAAAPADLICAALAWSHAVTSADAATWFQAPTFSFGLAVAVVAAAPVTVVWSAILHRALGRLERGTWPIRSWTYLRLWLKADLLDAASTWLSGTLLWSRWLRAAGMRIGRGCEISTIIDAVPELITVGHESFFADGIYLAGPRLAGGLVELESTRIGSGVFLGNHAIVPAGHDLADGVLVGVSTVADARMRQPHTSWFGHPPFALARPASTWDRSLTHDPSRLRRLNRWGWEVSRFTLPVIGAAIGAWWLATLAARVPGPAPGIVAQVVLVSAVAGAMPVAFVLTLKWLLLGRVRPGEHPLWSCWCSRWDFVYVAWAQLARPFVSPLEGTLLLNWYLRAMGARVGRRVVLGPGFSQVVDPDMLTIEADATVHALLQAHTFEEHVLKIDRVRIGARSTVAHGVVPLYGADIGADATVLANSVVMKHEHLPPQRVYFGSPVREVR